MNAGSLVRLVVLSAIWGGSFLLIRIGAPALGPVPLMESRVVLAAIFLAGVGLWWRRPLMWRAHWRHYAILGCFNSALPFLLLGYAALTLPASILSVLNATATMWGALIARLWHGTPLSARTVTGLLLGVVGVALLVGFDAAAMHPGATLAIAASLGSAFSYAVASNYARSARAVEPLATAQGSMWAASLAMAPVLVFVPAPAVPNLQIALSVLALGIVCSGIAYALYFRLIGDIGAAPALTVAFLIPLFGVLWGWLFLDESVGWHTLVGAAVVIVGTALVTGFSLRSLRPASAR